MPSNNKGFTLIEVLIAMTILTISVIVGLDAQNNIVSTSRRIEKMTQASLLAQQKLAETKLLMQQDKLPDEDKGDFGESYPDYRWERKVVPTDLQWSIMPTLIQLAESTEGEEKTALFTPLLKSVKERLDEAITEVAITIYWKEGKGERKYTITTHKVNYNVSILPTG